MASDVIVDAISTLTPTSTGTVAYTFNLGGRTPKAIVVVGTGSTTANISGAGALKCWGAATASQEWCTSISSKTAVGTSDTYRRAISGAVLQYIGFSGAVFVKATVSSFSANTVTLNYSAVDASTRALQIIAFAGDDLEVDAQIVTAVDASTTAVTTSFLPRMIIAGNIISGGFTDSAAASSALVQGIATYDGTTIRQSSLMGLGIDNTGTSNATGIIHNNALIVGTSSTTVVTVSNIDTTGYDLTANFAGNAPMGLLHLGFPMDIDAWCGVVSMPTADGAKTFSDTAGTAAGLDFIPQFCGAFATTETDVNTYAQDGDTAGSTRSTAYFLPNGDSSCIGFTDEDNVDTTNTNSHFYDQDNAGGMPLTFLDSGTAEDKITAFDMTSEGISMTFDKVAGSAASLMVLFALERKPDVDFAVDYISTLTPTSTGTQDYTFDLGGRTPKAVIAICSTNRALNDTRSEHGVAWGAGTASQEWCCSIASQDAQATSNTWRRAIDGAVCQLAGSTTGSVLYKATIDSFSPNTVTLDFTTITGGFARGLILIAFAGDDLEVDAQVVAATASTTTAVTTTFEPNVIFGGGIALTAFGDTAVAGSDLIQSLATWDGSTLRQTCISGSADDNVTTTICRGSISDERFSSDSGAVNVLTLSDVDATGYTITNALGFNRALGLLHLGLPAGYKAWVGVHEQQTVGTGSTDTINNSTGTAPGFDFSPDLIMCMVGTTDYDLLNSWNTGSTPGASRTTAVSKSNAGVFNYSMIAAIDEHNVSPSNTNSLFYDQDDSNKPLVINPSSGTPGNGLVKVTDFDLSGEGISFTYNTASNTNHGYIFFGVGPIRSGAMNFDFGGIIGNGL